MEDKQNQKIYLVVSFYEHSLLLGPELPKRNLSTDHGNDIDNDNTRKQWSDWLNEEK